MNKLAFLAITLASLTSQAATVSLSPAPGFDHVKFTDTTTVLNITHVKPTGGAWVDFGDVPVSGSTYVREFWTDADSVFIAGHESGITLPVWPYFEDVDYLLDYFHVSENLVQYAVNYNMGEVITTGNSGVVAVPEPTVTVLLLAMLLCVTSVSTRKRRRKKREVLGLCV